MFPVALAVIGAGALIGGTYLQYRGQKKAAEAQQKQQALATRRSRRQAIREAQIREGQTINIAGGINALQSSGTAGGLGSLGSQLASNFGFGTQMSGLSSLVNQGQQQAALGSGIASLGSTALSTGLSFYQPTPSGGAGQPTQAPVPRPNPQRSAPYNWVNS